MYRLCYKGSCSEMASLGYPIMDRGKLLGVIGVLAFDLEQKQRIHKRLRIFTCIFK